VIVSELRAGMTISVAGTTYLVTAVVTHDERDDPLTHNRHPAILVDVEQFPLRHYDKGRVQFYFHPNEEVSEYGEEKTAQESA